MIAFFQTGGIGDAILGTSVVKKLRASYGAVTVCYCDHLVPQVYQGVGFVDRLKRIDMATVRTAEALGKSLSGFDFVVFNKFRRGPDGKLNFFIPVSPGSVDICEGYRRGYAEALSSDIGRRVSDISDIHPVELMRFFNSESDYFSDWRRYGLGCGYGDVSVEIFPYTKERNGHDRWPAKFIVVHDSRLPVDGRSGYPMKAWSADLWKVLCGMIRDRLGLPVVQILSDGQERFADFVIPHDVLIGKDAMFQDYLDLLDRSSVYVGTDSWPAHAAIFIRNPKYVLLKGAVSRRWDHGGVYSRIIRSGSCQACEGPWANKDRCMWHSGHPCMESITPEMVFAEIEEALQ